MRELATKVVLAILVVFAPIQGMLLSALGLIVADFILGIYAAYKANEPITSAGFRRTISKILVYEIAICLAYVAQHFLLNDSIQISNIVAGFVGLTELKSCLENLNAISGGQLLKKLLEKLGSVNQ